MQSRCKIVIGKKVSGGHSETDKLVVETSLSVILAANHGDRSCFCLTWTGGKRLSRVGRRSTSTSKRSDGYHHNGEGSPLQKPVFSRRRGWVAQVKLAPLLQDDKGLKRWSMIMINECRSNK